MHHNKTVYQQNQIEIINEISDSVDFPPYLIDTVTLIKANASLTNCLRLQTWKLDNC